MNRNFLLIALMASVGCTQTAAKPTAIQTGAVTRRDIEVDVTATGVIEPINVIEVKSKTASGQVMKMPIEIGTNVRPGDLIVQIDTTDLHTQHKQAVSDLAAAQSNFDVAQAQLARQQKLFADRIITRPELESAQTTFATAQATLLRNQASLDLSDQKLRDATVNAAVAGTIITKPVSLGQVIQAGGQSVSGGSVIATMADLSKVRARALVNETDIGSVRSGQPVNVTVDAFPDHPFAGVIEKIEPQATVQQNVTMFPVRVSLDNSEGLLKPGMNGEVSILTDMRSAVIAVPNDAIRSVREAAQAAALLGMNPDSVTAQLGAGRPGGRGMQGQVSRGELALTLVQGEEPTGGAKARRGRGPRGGEPDGKGSRSRSGLVFVEQGTGWKATTVRLGVANFDYTEVLDGLKEGDKVALLSVASLQAKRQEQNDRMKKMIGGSSPLGGAGRPR